LPLYNRDIIIEPASGSIIFSGSAGAFFSEIIVDDSGSISLTITESGTFSITGSTDITGSLNISGTLSTDDFILRGTLDLGTF
jgi:hypothetical protein